MKFDQLRNLIAAGRTGSIRQAARDLNLSQPAVTKSIKLLEEELGCSLLHRQSHGVIPTASGEALIKRALSIETELNNARNEIDKIEGVTTGDIRVSASPSVAINLMPRAILNLKKSRPNVTVHIEELVYPHVLPAVRSGELDMAVCLMPHGLDADDLDVEVLLEDSLTPAVRSDHHLARKQKLSLKELLDEEWVIFGRRGESRDIYEQTFRQNGLEAPRSTIECTSFTCALALVERSDYLVLVPRQIFADRHKAWPIKPLSLQTPMQPWTIAAITRADTVPSPACQVFQDELRKSMSQLGKARRNGGAG
jgi:DNA-binding transcriptional LysR family regulator